MPVDALKALQFESEFLSGVEANFESAKGVDFRGSSWQQSHHDEGDRLRALMAEHRNYDRALLKRLPSNRRVVLQGFDRRLFFWRRRTGVAVGSVLSPLVHYASGADGDAPPVGLGELIDHARDLVSDKKVPHVIGICSPSGFTEEARNARVDVPNATIVLIEPDEKGGWRTTAAGDDVDPRLLKIFDPEGPKQKLQRVRHLIDDSSADLLTGGLSVDTVARRAQVPEPAVREAFELAAKADPELRLTRKEGTLLLYRGAPMKRRERSSMNVIDRIRQLLSGEGDDTEKINVLAERRAALAQRRDRMYEDIAKLETREADLLAQGKAATSSVPRRRLAAQLAQLRKDIARQNTSAAMLNKQIDIISTDIHNLTLIQQGQMAQLPDSTELTEHAVAAEEMLETLQTDAELVGSLESNMEQSLASEEELAILREFEEADEPAAVQPRPQRSPAQPAPEQRADESPARSTEEESAPPPPESQRRPADPEAT